MSDLDSEDGASSIRQISVEDLGRLGIDANNRLYWDKKRVETRIGFTRLQKALAFIIGLCAILGGLGGFVTGLKDASEFLCARGQHWLSCPDVPASRLGASLMPKVPGRP